MLFRSDTAEPWPPGANPRVDPAPTGRFTVERSVFAAEDRPWISSVALGDCDDDGMIDALTLSDRAPLVVYRGFGGGRFEALATGLPRASSRVAIFVDVDRDGAEDIVTADEDVAVYRNLGGCRFESRRVIAPPTRDLAIQILEIGRAHV